MENNFCDIHGCQMEEREDPEGQNRIGHRIFVCLVCEEEGRTMAIFELRKNHRVQALKGVSYAKGKNCPECVWCGAMLPCDEKFQAAHMQQCQINLAEQQKCDEEEQRCRLAQSWDKVQRYKE